MNWVALERGGIAVGIYFFARVWARWRTERRERAALTLPLVDAALLEAVFHPRHSEGDDADLLAELRDTFAHLNRRAYAEEFWGLHAQIAALDRNLGPPQRATLRRAVLRLLATHDRWLQIVGAKTSGALEMPESLPLLRGLLAQDTSESPASDAQERRYRQELEEALAMLTR